MVFYEELRISVLFLRLHCGRYDRNNTLREQRSSVLMCNLLLNKSAHNIGINI